MELQNCRNRGKKIKKNNSEGKKYGVRKMEKNTGREAKE